MSAPLITVVVVCRNPGPRVRAALASVWSQAETGVETVVIDGASTDGTREWLEGQRTRVATLMSEPDAGIYEAMNKGVSAASGEWLLFLGADDRLEHNALARISPMLRQSDAAVVAGEAAYEDGRIYFPASSDHAIRRNFVHHQAAFYRRTLFARYGQFETGLRIMADYEFNLRLLTSGMHFGTVALCVANCGRGGLSDAGGWAGYWEEIQVRHRYFAAWRCWPWDAGSIIRFLRKKTLRLRFSHV
jgi:putative colanic acid biosynthesis glycosyltransferase